MFILVMKIIIENINIQYIKPIMMNASTRAEGVSLTSDP